MKTRWIAAVLAGLMVTMTPLASDAKRLGGGKPAGMQRSVPDKPAPAAPAANPNAPPAAAPAAAPTAGAQAAPGVAPRRSWLGPIAGLAAGLGLAALLGHFGLGGEFANLMMMVLLAGVAFFVIRLLLQRFAGGAVRGGQPLPAGAAGGHGVPPEAGREAPRAPWAPVAAAPSVALAGPAAATAAPTLPAGFDAEAFQRLAKTIFIRLQAANDSADLNDLRNFTTPELYASLRVDLHERGAAPQRTDVVTVDADVLEFVQEAGRQIVSVRFHGLLREEAGGAAAPFDEVWHLVRQGDAPGWVIGGIQPVA